MYLLALLTIHSDTQYSELSMSNQAAKEAFAARATPTSLSMEELGKCNRVRSDGTARRRKYDPADVPLPLY